MDATVTDKANLILDKLMSYIDSGIDAAPAFIVDLSREYITYFIIDSFPVMALLIAVCSFLALCATVYFTVKENSDDAGVASILIGAVFVMSVAFLGQGLKTIVQAYHAPTAFVIEKIRK